MNAQVPFDGKNMTPFDAAKLAVDDLFEEAEVWLNGDGISSEGEAAAVETLLDLTRKARKEADEARKVENEPFDTGKAEVQARYNPVLKRADLIADTCKKVLQPWREKVAAEKAAIADQARRDFEEIRRKAEEEIRASAGNIVARAEAEHLLNSAKLAEKDSKKADKQATTGLGLRTSYRPVLTDLNAAVRHYWATYRAEFETLVCDMAARDARAGKREIPGFEIKEEKVAI
jgi:hypothetical protein